MIGPKNQLYAIGGGGGADLARVLPSVDSAWTTGLPSLYNPTNTYGICLVQVLSVHNLNRHCYILLRLSNGKLIMILL